MKKYASASGTVTYEPASFKECCDEAIKVAMDRWNWTRPHAVPQPPPVGWKFRLSEKHEGAVVSPWSKNFIDRDEQPRFKVKITAYGIIRKTPCGVQIWHDTSRCEIYIGEGNSWATDIQGVLELNYRRRKQTQLAICRKGIIAAEMGLAGLSNSRRSHQELLKEIYEA